MPVSIGRVDVSAYTVPTDQVESDGTLVWDATTCVVVEVHAGGQVGLGYTYADAATATLIADTLADVVTGRDPEADRERVAGAREAIGPDLELYVDANGAWTRKQALAQAERLAAFDVRWLEEPVSSDDLEGLRLLRDRAPVGMDIAAGEYGYDLPYFRRMLDAGAVDCLRADVTRCAGITGFRRVGALCDAHGIDLSAHCAPQVSAHACAGVWHLRHLEYFHDHVRIESLLFDGGLEPEDGTLRPDRSRPGLGLEVKRADAAQYAA